MRENMLLTLGGATHEGRVEEIWAGTMKVRLKNVLAWIEVEHVLVSACLKQEHQRRAGT